MVEFFGTYQEPSSLISVTRLQAGSQSHLWLPEEVMLLLLVLTIWLNYVLEIKAQAMHLTFQARPMNHSMCTSLMA